MSNRFALLAFIFCFLCCCSVPVFPCGTPKFHQIFDILGHTHTHWLPKKRVFTYSLLLQCLCVNRHKRVLCHGQGQKKCERRFISVCVCVKDRTKEFVCKNVCRCVCVCVYMSSAGVWVEINADVLAALYESIVSFLEQIDEEKPLKSTEFLAENLPRDLCVFTAARRRETSGLLALI